MKNKNLIITTFSLLVTSSFNFGQIDLGTAAGFVLFTSVGAIDNVGPSHFIGDIGTNAGAITGFPPGTLTGVIYHEDTISLQVAADVEDAYNYLTGIPCDSIISEELGGGQILTPYTYCVLTAAALIGELILDAENDPNALFIIKIAGVLDVIGLSEIILINAASASNVYWQIDGAGNIGENTVFNGTILGNGALSFADSVELNGRGLCRQGAISTSTMSAIVPDDNSLPIELIYFKGINMQNHNLISWSTASELNNNYFTLEMTTDGLTFIELVRVSGAGTSSYSNVYTYSDFDFDPAINYYRLTQTDYDGEFESFNLISINNLPTQHNIIHIFNMMGQQVDKDYSGLRVIYFSNGETLKVIGK
jgi:hypothetical protein